MSCLSWCTQFPSIAHGEREKHLQSDSWPSKIDSCHLSKINFFPLTVMNPCMISPTWQSSLNAELFLALFSSPPLIKTSTPWYGWHNCLPSCSMSQLIKLIQAKNNWRGDGVFVLVLFWFFNPPARSPPWCVSAWPHKELCWHTWESAASDAGTR